MQTYEERLSKELDIVIGTTETGLDSRRAAVRDHEAAIGNLITDAMREAVGAQVAMINGGGIRANRDYPPGPSSPDATSRASCRSATRR